MRSFVHHSVASLACWCVLTPVLTPVAFLVSNSRIDFRELVRDLFAIYKTRIWLQQVVPGGGKKVLVDYDAN